MTTFSTDFNMKADEHNRLIVLIVILAAVLSVFVYFYGKSFVRPSQVYNPEISPASSSQIYTSKSLNFSISVPNYYRVEDRLTTLLIKSERGEIVVSRIATNFENVNQYFEDLKIKNKLNVLNMRNVNIGVFNGLSVDIKKADNLGERRDYFIYVNGWVYSFSSSSKDLYDDLDQIAGSFRYIGE